MADTEDMDALAKRYISLWQDQLAQVSGDPSVMEAWRPVFEGAAKSLGWTPDAVDTYAAALRGAVQNAAASATGATAGAKTSASSFDGGSAGYADVLRRLDALEQRVAALEPDKSGVGRNPGKSGSKRTSKPGAKKEPTKRSKKRSK
ncbi:MAG: hypothetical protein RIF37_10580 [Rhodospirillaceae bacterium]|jgi:hypothetical protein